MAYFRVSYEESAGTEGRRESRSPRRVDKGIEAQGFFATACMLNSGC